MHCTVCPIFCMDGIVTTFVRHMYKLYKAMGLRHIYYHELVGYRKKAYIKLSQRNF
jgi:hypothetical protein